MERAAAYEIILSMVQGLGIMALAAILYGSTLRIPVGERIRSVLQGLIFGIGAAVVMQFPTQLAPGVIVDARSIFVAFAAAFGGLPAALVSAVIAISARVAVGGSGTLAGVVGIVLAVAGGYAWARLPVRIESRPVKLLLLGPFASLNLISAFLLPFDTAVAFLTRAAPPVIVMSIVGAVILGLFVERELALVRRETRLRTEAGSDHLSGLLNRRAFHNEVETAYEQGDPGAPAALLFIDIDNFKSVNDTHGHDAGDAAIRQVATTIASQLRAGQPAARLGGEEFGVHLNVTRTVALAVAERIRAAIETTPIKAGSTTFRVTVSIGVASSRTPATFDELFRIADRMLHRAKDQGRNRTLDAELGPEASRRDALRAA